MTSNWQKIKLEEVVERINTGLDAIRRAPIVSYPTQIKCLRIQDISQKKSISEWGFTEVKDSDYENYRLRKGEIIMARTCSTGINYLVKDDLNAVFNNGLARLRVKKSRVNEKFLFYIFRSSSFINYISGISCGTSVQLNMKVGDLANYEFLLPSISEQNKIANILGTLDEKIELNKKSSKTLEEISKALFKSWFIDFDPVKAKSEGRSTGLPNDISNLFPDSFEDNKLEEIPKSWKIFSLKQLSAYLSRGISPKYCDEGKGVLVINQKCIRDGIVDFSKARNHDPLLRKIDGREIQKFDCLINSTGVGTLGRVAMTPEIKGETIIVDSHVTVIRGKNNEQSFFLSMLLLHRQEEIESLGEGSTGQTELSKKILGDLEIIFPSEKLINQFYIYSLSLLEKKWLNEKTNLKLCELRDTLLPKLISGELRIPDAEKIIEEVSI